MKFKMLPKPYCTVIDWVVVTLLCLCPILQHYRGIFVNASVTILLAIFPVAAYRLLCIDRSMYKRILMVLPLIVFFALKVVLHGTTLTEAGQAGVFAVVVAAVSCDCFDIRIFRRVLVWVASAAAVLIVIQYICFYLFKFHLQLAPTSLLLDKWEQWVPGAQTGLVGVTGRPSRVYRPSAFFLEPSHMFIYLYAPMMMNMLGNKMGKKEFGISVLLSVGIVLTTSGMGMACVAGSWFLFLCKNGVENRDFHWKNLLRTVNLIAIAAAVVLAVAMFFTVPFFRKSVERIFTSGSTYRNAIAGRIASSTKLLRSRSLQQLIIGASDTLDGITYNMSGFAKTMYCYGIVGTVVSYIFYVMAALKLRGAYPWIFLVTLVLSYFSSHTHTTFFMLLITLTFMSGYHFTCETDGTSFRETNHIKTLIHKIWRKKA